MLIIKDMFHIREKKDKYLIDIDLPGFEKENISLSLKDGYLEVAAKTEKENKSDDERVVRQDIGLYAQSLAKLQPHHREEKRGQQQKSRWCHSRCW